jgi:asparagine synthetase B (glutamine-hydrolysing)
MNHVEYRVPLLDEDLVSFALSIPFWQKSNSKETKRFLRYLHAKIYPEETSKAPKHGFSIPLDVYLSKEEFARIGDAVLGKNSYVSNFIRTEYVQFLFDALEDKQDFSGHISRSAIYQRILMLYSLDLWHKNN